MGIDRDRRDLVQCVRDRREIALGVIAKRCCMPRTQGIGDSSRRCKVKRTTPDNLR